MNQSLSMCKFVVCCQYSRVFFHQLKHMHNRFILKLGTAVHWKMGQILWKKFHMWNIHYLKGGLTHIVTKISKLRCRWRGTIVRFSNSGPFSDAKRKKSWVGQVLALLPFSKLYFLALTEEIVKGYISLKRSIEFCATINVKCLKFSLE